MVWLYGMAARRVLTEVCSVPMSMGSLSITWATEPRKKLKVFPAWLITILSADRKHKRFLKKKTSWIVCPTKDGQGLVVRSPADRVDHEPASTEKNTPLVESIFRRTTNGMVVSVMVVKTSGATVSRQYPLAAVESLTNSTQ